jgi:hypothetical protein
MLRTPHGEFRQVPRSRTFYTYSRLLSKNVKIRIYETIILPLVLYGRETWSLTLREEHRLRVFENRVLRRIFGPKKDEVSREWRNCITRSFVICTLLRV